MLFITFKIPQSISAATTLRYQFSFQERTCERFGQQFTVEIDVKEGDKSQLIVQSAPSNNMELLLKAGRMEDHSFGTFEACLEAL